ncbi:MAG: hypothetical protein DKT66_07160 [Candidatus Melainabacteria bacterium]|nr:MAG: hypothetical protein DKT66_07160 [Candidatus Melainabacteria bacterium]
MGLVPVTIVPESKVLTAIILAGSLCAGLALSDSLQRKKQYHALELTNQGQIVLNTNLTSHKLVICAIQTLAYKRRMQGQYEEAIRLQQQAVQLNAAQYGKDSAQCIDAKTELACCYSEFGQFQAASCTLEKALKMSREKLGNNDEVTDRLRLVLAYQYELQGRFRESEELHKERLQNYGPQGLACLSNLARVYAKQHKHTDALLLYKQMDQAFPNQLQSMHLQLTPKTISPAQAEETKAFLLGQVAKYASNMYSPWAKVDLAKFYGAQNDPKSAERLLRAAINEQEKKKIDSSFIKLLLADLLLVNGHSVKSMQIYKANLERKQLRLGFEHIDTAIDFEHLGSAYEQQLDFQTAEAMYKKALSLRLLSLHKQHPDVGRSYRDLARVLSIKAKLEKTSEYDAERIAFEREAQNSFHDFLGDERRLDSERDWASRR